MKTCLILLAAVVAAPISAPAQGMATGAAISPPRGVGLGLASGNSNSTPGGTPLLASGGRAGKICIVNLGVQVAGPVRNAPIRNQVTTRNVKVECR